MPSGSFWKLGVGGIINQLLICRKFLDHIIETISVETAMKEDAQEWKRIVVGELRTNSVERMRGNPSPGWEVTPHRLVLEEEFASDGSISSVDRLLQHGVFFAIISLII